MNEVFVAIVRETDSWELKKTHSLSMITWLRYRHITIAINKALQWSVNWRVKLTLSQEILLATLNRNLLFIYIDL